MSLNFLPKETENGSTEGVMVYCDISPRMDKGWGLQFRGVDQDIQHSSMDAARIHPRRYNFCFGWLVCFVVYLGFL